MLAVFIVYPAEMYSETISVKRLLISTYFMIFSFLACHLQHREAVPRWTPSDVGLAKSGRFGFYFFRVISSKL